MSETAILVVENRSLLNETWSESFAGESQPGAPTACLEILGSSILERTVERLQKAGVNRIWLVAQDAAARFIPRYLRKRTVTVHRNFEEASAINRISEQEAAKGAQTIIVIRLSAYIEFDAADMLQSHYSAGAGSTTVCDIEGSLPIRIVSAVTFAQSGMSVDAAFSARTPSYFLSSYVNRLTSPADLRRLVVDALSGRCEMEPRGRQVKPGVWLGDGARVHRDAQLIAPVYIGRKARLHARAMVTGYSNVECGSVIGCGSIIEQSCVLARTHIGKGLEVLGSVVDGARLINLHRNVAVEITDRTMACAIEPWYLIRFSRKPARKDVFVPATAKTTGVPLSPARVPIYLHSSKEQYEQWEACNRQAIT